MNPNNIVDQMRLLTGDFLEDEPYLEDSVYLWFYQKNNNSVVEASIEALESIINNIALSPASWEIGDSSESRQTMESLERRLKSLKEKKYKVKSPVIIGSDRKNWDDFDKVFNFK